MKAEDLRELQEHFNGAPSAAQAIRGNPRKHLLGFCIDARQRWSLFQWDTRYSDAATLAKLIHELVTEEKPDRQWLRNELKELRNTPD